MVYVFSGTSGSLHTAWTGFSICGSCDFSTAVSSVVAVDDFMETSATGSATVSATVVAAGRGRDLAVTGVNLMAGRRIIGFTAGLVAGVLVLEGAGLSGTLLNPSFAEIFWKSL